MRTNLLCAVTILAWVLPDRGAIGAPKSNSVVIFVDDIGYGYIELYGSEVNATPHLKRMAKEGSRSNF